DQAPGDRCGCLRDLIRIGKVKLAAMPEAGGPKGQFPALNQGSIPRDRPEEIRFSDIVMIQPIRRSCLVSIGVKRPAAKRDREPKLVLFIPLAAQGRESKILAVR